LTLKNILVKIAIFHLPVYKLMYYNWEFNLCALCENLCVLFVKPYILISRKENKVKTCKDRRKSVSYFSPPMKNA